MTRWLPIGLLVFATALIGCNRGNAPKGDSGKKDEQAVRDDATAKDAKQGKKDRDQKVDEKPVDAKPDFTTDVRALVKEFEADKNAADAKYKEKVLEISGPLAGVCLHYSTAFTLTPDTKDPRYDGREVFCEGPAKLAGKIARHAPGQNFKVIGKYKRCTNDIQIDLYEIIVHEPGKLVPMTDVELAMDFAMDAVAARNKYQPNILLPGKDVVLTGTVRELKKAGGGYAAVLARAGKVTVEAEVPAVDYESWKSVKQVELRSRETIIWSN